MSGKRIPQDVRAQVEAIVAQFNQTVVRDPETFFSVRFRGRYVYLDRDDYGPVGPRDQCRSYRSWYQVPCQYVRCSGSR